MKICGCEDAEKGYVIINPDSPDRKQILSLNPPVCYESRINALDVDGEFFFFKKEIETYEFNPLPSGIKVNWGSGDVVVLSGTNWNIDSSTGEEVWVKGTVTANCSSWIPAEIKLGSIPSGAVAPSNQTIRNSPSTGCPQGTALHQQGIQLNALQGFLDDSYALVTWQSMPTIEKRAKQGKLFAIGTVTGNCSTWLSNFEIELGTISLDGELPNQTIRNAPSTGCPSGFPLYQQGIQLNPINGYPATNSGSTYYLVTWQSIPELVIRPIDTGESGITVTTDTGESSSRNTIIFPSVSLFDGGCEIVIDFIDDSQLILEYPQCPQDIKKINSLEVSDISGVLDQIAPEPMGGIVIQCGDRQCPPGTCFNCDCSELNCCYDESGKLIDSFIRRT